MKRRPVPSRRAFQTRLGIAVVVLALTSSPVAAQWAANGADISNTNAGNVGVGTTTPPVKLSVEVPNVSDRTPVLRLRAGTASDNVVFEITPG